MTARLPVGTRREVGLPISVFARIAGRVMGTSPPGVFLTLGHNRRLFWAWLHFASRLMPRGRLERRETELVIVRVAVLADSAYELAQHLRLARRAKVTAAELEQVQSAAPGHVWDESWSDRDRLLLQVTDELYADRDLSDATWTAVRAEFDSATAVELVMLVGHYQMLATTLHALRVQPDAPRKRGPGWSSRLR